MVKSGREITLETPAAEMDATLTVEPSSQGIVIFAHGSGSGRFSPRNRAVAEMLHNASIGTLLLDLLTPQEQRTDEITRELRFNIDLLSQRVIAAVDWISQMEQTEKLPIGIFGASTGAAAALVAAAKRTDFVQAVVSRGGRGDMAAKDLPNVRAPVLLIVGGNDPDVLRLNQQVQSMLHGHSELVIIRGASHLFEEPGTLEQAALHTVEWFSKYLHPVTAQP